MSSEQLVVLGLVASIVVWVLKIIFTDKGDRVPSWILTSGLYVVAFVLALVFNPVVLPPFPPFSDAPSFVSALLGYLNLLLPILAAAAGFATLIYQVILKRVLDGIGEEVKKEVDAITNDDGSDIG